MDRPSVSAYQKLFSAASPDELARLIGETRSDSRAGVRRVREQAIKKLGRIEAERLRVESLMTLQSSLHAKGFGRVAGIDEVGRGALAGPVTAAAVILPEGAHIDGIDDSKRLTPEARIRIAAIIEQVALAFAVAHVPAHVIDSLGIGAATRTAMVLSLDRLHVRPDHVVTDGLAVGLPYPETAVVRADSSVACVAAASILAKVARDGLMDSLANSYDRHSLELNKGYGTPDHLSAIGSHGVTPIHRLSFAPCAPPMSLF